MMALENRLKIKISKYNVMVMNMEGLIKIKYGIYWFKVEGMLTIN